MVSYRYLTRREAIEWQAQHPVDPGDPLADMRNGDYAYCDMEQRVAVVAFDGDRIVGRNFFFHCPLLVDGRLVECVVTYNLYVDPAYRPRGVGTYIKMHVLRLGYPQISSGVSPEMQKVQDAWSAYRKVDAHPVYSIPVDPIGLLRVARISAEARASVAPAQGVLSAALRQARGVAALSWGGAPGLRLLAPDEALRHLDSVLGAERPPVQLPWNLKVLDDALHARRANVRGWVVQFQSADPAPRRYLVSAYIRSRTYRTFGARQRRSAELHLNEIFPPVRDPRWARALLRFALQQARGCGASILQVYAMTDALREACAGLGFETFFGKHVYIAPNTKDKALAQTISNPDNWWCRAINEDQFDEVGLPRPGLPLTPDPDLAIFPRPQ